MKLDEQHQSYADTSYNIEKEVIELIDDLEESFNKQRWFSIGRTNIEQGFMALRKGITESYKAKLERDL